MWVGRHKETDIRLRSCFPNVYNKKRAEGKGLRLSLQSSKTTLADRLYWHTVIIVIAYCLLSVYMQYHYCHYDYYNVLITLFNFFLWRLQPNPGHGLLIPWGFRDHTQRNTTVGRTPLDEWSARHTDLYPTTHNTHNRQTSKPPAGFEPTISADERSQTYALDRAATVTGPLFNYLYKNCYVSTEFVDYDFTNPQNLTFISFKEQNFTCSV